MAGMANNTPNVPGQGIRLPCLKSDDAPADVPHKGYEIGEEEVKISLDDFRKDYADPSGAPESVSLPNTIDFPPPNMSV